MQKLFAWPIKPHILNQPWGVLRPEVYSKFGFTRHNGLDHRIIDSDGYAYAPFEYTVLDTFDQSEGGGLVCSILSEPIAFDAFICTTPDGVSISFQAGTYRVRLDLLHNEKFLVKPGDKGKAGDKLVKCDNTGFSTGPHCHTQWRRVLDDGNYTHADTNDANNSFDPTQFFDSFYAQDVPQVVSTFQQIITLLKRIISVALP